MATRVPPLPPAPAGSSPASGTCGAALTLERVYSSFYFYYRHRIRAFPRPALRPPPVAVRAVAGGAGQRPAAHVERPGLVNLFAARDLLGGRRERPLEEQHMPPLLIGESHAERRRTVRRTRSEGRHCRMGPSAGHRFVHAERAVQTHLHHIVEVGRMAWQLLTSGADPNQ